MVERFNRGTSKQTSRACAILCLSAEQQTDKRVDSWECYAEYAMFNAIRISRKLGGNTSTFTFVFKMIFISRCICYSTFLPGIIFLFFIRSTFVHFVTSENIEFSLAESKSTFS